jgi:hypothetical protein
MHIKFLHLSTNRFWDLACAAKVYPEEQYIGDIERGQKLGENTYRQWGFRLQSAPDDMQLAETAGEKMMTLQQRLQEEVLRTIGQRKNSENHQALANFNWS